MTVVSVMEGIISAVAPSSLIVSGRPISNIHCFKACPDISVTTIERTLAELIACGFIEKVGTGRATAYIKK